MRVVQPVGSRGSLKWIQRAVDERWPELEVPVRARLGEMEIDWLSPCRDDDNAEYRDAAFLERLGLSKLAAELSKFWPARGPQWDALGRSSENHIILVQAKAHIGEFCTPATAAGEVSRERIIIRLGEVAADLGSQYGSRWPDQFYQLANRLAHLWFLRRRGVDAHLLLVGFLDDKEMQGPSGAETWQAAYRIADYVLGLGARHALSPFILHAYPSVAHYE